MNYQYQNNAIYIHYGDQDNLPMSTQSIPILKGVNGDNYLVFDCWIDAYDFLADEIKNEAITISQWHDSNQACILFTDIFTQSEAFNCWLLILAIFEDSQQGEIEANEFMTRVKGASVLKVSDGKIYLADFNEKGFQL